MNKAELIKQLYEEGKITIDQVIALSSNETTESPAETGLSEINTESEKGQLDPKEQFIKDLVDGIVERNVDCDGDLLSFDIDKIVNFMKNDGWKWRDNVVTFDDFKNTMASLLDGVIRKTVDDYLSSQWRDKYQEDDLNWPCYHTISSGGIEVESWYNSEEEIIEVNAKFVAEETMTYKSINDLQDCQHYESNFS